MPSAQHGGKRAGAGRPAGTEEQATIDKRTNRALIRAIVAKRLEPLINAQVDNALGITYMVLRAPDGSFVRATDEKQLDAAIAMYNAGDTNVLKLYTKEPHHGAAATLLAYAADKPVEPVEVTGAEGGPIEIADVLQAARGRLARAQRD